MLNVQQKALSDYPSGIRDTYYDRRVEIICRTIVMCVLLGNRGQIGEPGYVLETEISRFVRQLFRRS